MLRLRWFLSLFLELALSGYCWSQLPDSSQTAVPYLKLSTPQRILPEAQAWEQQRVPPHSQRA